MAVVESGVHKWGFSKGGLSNNGIPSVREETSWLDISYYLRRIEAYITHDRAVALRSETLDFKCCEL